MIERYGEQIEADLFERGWDLLDYFRGTRPWPQLVRIVDTLPSWSNTSRAMSDDDDLHAFRERSRSRGPGPRMSLSNWTEFDELIATIGDAANAIRTTIVGVNTGKGQKPPKFKPARRPRTAAERAALRKDSETVSDIVSMLKPRGEG